jgi:hypothetical protein
MSGCGHHRRHDGGSRVLPANRRVGSRWGCRRGGVLAAWLPGLLGGQAAWLVAQSLWQGGPSGRACHQVGAGPGGLAERNVQVAVLGGLCDAGTGELNATADRGFHDDGRVRFGVRRAWRHSQQIRHRYRVQGNVAGQVGVVLDFLVDVLRGRELAAAPQPLHGGQYLPMPRPEHVTGLDQAQEVLLAGRVGQDRAKQRLLRAHIRPHISYLN